MLNAEIDPSLPDKIVLHGEYRWHDPIRTLQGAKFSAPLVRRGEPKLPQAWRVPLSWQTCLALRTTFGQELVVGPNLSAWAKEYRRTIVDPAMALRMETEADLPGYEDLFGYQRAGVKFLAMTKRAILADGMGAGKTRSSISTLKYLSEQGEDVFPALIVAPNSTLLSWEREIETVWPGHTINVVKGTATQRRKLLETEAAFYIINWEGLRFHSRLVPYGSQALKLCEDCGGHDPKVKPAACQKHEKELNAIDFKSAIGDEIHRIKDGSTAAARALKASTANTPIKLALSGTPIASSPGDLWSPLNWILPDVYPGRGAFVDRFMDTVPSAWGRGKDIIGINSRMEAEFYGGLDPHFRAMPKELVLSFLPPKVYERRDVEMGTKQAKAYKQMAAKMLAEMDDGDILRATSPMQKAGRLRQLASSFGDVEERIEMVINEETGEVEPRLRQKLILKDPSCKIDAFLDDLPDFGDESISVFAVSRQLVELLSSKLDKLDIRHGLITGEISGEDRQRHMDDFQAGRTKIILATTGAGGTGVTLTAASIAAFLQRPYNPIESAQSEDRQHRIGSEVHESVRIIDYVTIDTIDSAVFPVLDKKGEHLETILRSKDALRKILTENKLPEDDE